MRFKNLLIDTSQHYIKILLILKLADGIADVILEDLALALKVLSLGKLAKLCSLRLVALHL